MAKPWPSRYPSNNDSIGIEIVGGFNSKINAYDTVNERQNTSLKWLISELTITLKISATEVFRHPTVSYKQPSEAATAKW
jgi:N-acetyl-anhydromuramyl-L-alanine amidase AmpD